MSDQYQCQVCSQVFNDVDLMVHHWSQQHRNADAPLPEGPAEPAEQALTDGQNEPTWPEPKLPSEYDEIVAAYPYPPDMQEPAVEQDELTVADNPVDTNDVTVLEPEPADDHIPLDVLINSLADLRAEKARLRDVEADVVDQIARQVGKPGDYEAGGVKFTVSSSRRRSNWDGQRIVGVLAARLADELAVDEGTGERLPPGVLAAQVANVVAETGGLFRGSHQWPLGKLRSHGIDPNSYSEVSESKASVRIFGDAEDSPW